jgi:hypothetical protein
LSRLDTVIADNVAIKADNQQLLGKIELLEDFVDPVAKRALLEKVLLTLTPMRGQDQRCTVNISDLNPVHFASLADF